MSIFNSTTKDGDPYIDLIMVDGIKTIKQDMPVRLTILKDGRMQISQRFFNNEPVYLKFSQITNAGIVTEKEIVEKSKHVVGRAVVGGLLLGPLGAVVGGMSGVGDKKKQKTNTYYVINYLSGTGGEPSVLSFKLAGGFPSAYIKFTERLKQLAGITETKTDEMFDHNL